MATGLGNKLTGQIGEYLVTAELGRRGIIATPFSGNVPDIDILAYRKGTTGHIQVKTINSGSWQFDISKFLNLKVTEKGQKIQGLNTGLDREIVCVFVALGKSLGQDEFYIFRLGWLQDYFKKIYKGRKPPHKVNSFHCAIWKKDILSHKDKWGIITRKFKVEGT
jgi:hypothetical protein